MPHAASGHHAVAMLAAASEGGIAATFSPYAHVVSSGRTWSGGRRFFWRLLAGYLGTKASATIQFPTNSLRLVARHMHIILDISPAA